MQDTDWSTLVTMVAGCRGSGLRLPLAGMIMIDFLIGAVVEGKGNKIAPLSFIALTINKILVCLAVKLYNHKANFMLFYSKSKHSNLTFN